MPVVKFAQDTLSHGAKGRNGYMKSTGVQLLEGSDALAIPEVPYVHVEPINSRNESTESCFIRWPFHDTPAIIDAVMEVHGFDAFKRKAVKDLLNDESDPKVDLELLDQESLLTAVYPGLHVVLQRDDEGTLTIEVFINGRSVHRLVFSVAEVRAQRTKNEDAGINWERRP